jgi:hypothetical protein
MLMWRETVGGGKAKKFPHFADAEFLGLHEGEKNPEPVCFTESPQDRKS